MDLTRVLYMIPILDRYVGYAFASDGHTLLASEFYLPLSFAANERVEFESDVCDWFAPEVMFVVWLKEFYAHE